jgi:hypothetical protein
MTALSLPARRQLPVPLVLGLQEGRRIVAHPIALTGFALTVVLMAVVTGYGPRDAFDVVTTGPTFYYGVFTFFAANLVASRDRRAHSGELLRGTPAPPIARVAGLCLGALVPTLLCAILVLAVHASSLARDLYVIAPTGWHLAQAPLTVLGGALLGIMVARVNSIPGTALLVMVAMFAVNVWLANHREDIQALGTYMSWTLWADEGRAWAGLEAGSPAWHVGYLAALCAMAATGAFLREAENRLQVLCIGGGFTAAAVAAGLLQLP